MNPYGHLMLAFEGHHVPPWLDDVLAGNAIAGVTLFRELNLDSPGQTAELVESLQAKNTADVSLLVAIDQEGGQLLGLTGSTPFAGNMALGAGGDTALALEVAAAMGHELTAVGINVNYAPVADVASRPDNPSLGIRSFGAEPEAVARFTRAMVEGFRHAGIVATPKHFVANVGAGGRDSYPIHYNERLLEEIYFPAFKAAIHQGGARSIMTAYNSIDGDPATASPWLLRETLKQIWGFDGFVISDAGATGGANVLHFTAADYPEATRNALEAGLDVIFQTSYDHYPLFWEAFQKGMISEAAIDEAVARVLRVKVELGLFEDPYVDPEAAARWNGHADHRALALELDGLDRDAGEGRERHRPAGRELLDVSLALAPVLLGRQVVEPERRLLAPDVAGGLVVPRNANGRVEILAGLEPPGHRGRATSSARS